MYKEYNRVARVHGKHSAQFFMGCCDVYIWNLRVAAVHWKHSAQFWVGCCDAYIWNLRVAAVHSWVVATRRLMK